MKKINKNKIKFFLGWSVLLALFTLSVGIRTSFIKLPVVNVVMASYSENYDDDRVLIGVSSNTFVAKVVRKDKTFVKENSDGMPRTRFYVEIIDNIKGNLNGRVYVDQVGGYLNGVLYVMDRDMGVAYKDGMIYNEKKGLTKEDKEDNKSNLLEVGNTYIMCTDNNRDGKFDLFSHSNGKILLSNNKKLTKEELKKIVNKSERVKELRKAYKNEKISIFQIMDNAIYNSYKKYTNKDRQRMLDEYYKESEKKIRENIIMRYMKKDIMITNKEIDKIVELNYKGLSKKVFNSPEESRKWYNEHEDEQLHSEEELWKLEKEIELRAKKQNFKEINQVNNNIFENKK